MRSWAAGCEGRMPRRVAMNCRVIGECGGRLMALFACSEIGLPGVTWPCLCRRFSSCALPAHSVQSSYSWNSRARGQHPHQPTRHAPFEFRALPSRPVPRWPSHAPRLDRVVNLAASEQRRQCLVAASNCRRPVPQPPTFLLPYHLLQAPSQPCRARRWRRTCATCN